MKTQLKEQVFQAADALITEGVKRPTNTQVRERIGSGSLSHISPLMNQWRSMRSAEHQAAITMPSDLKILADSTLHQFWSSANAISGKALEAAKLEHAEVLEHQCCEINEMLNEVQRLENSLSEEKNAHQKCKTAASEAKDRLEEKALELATLNQKLASQNTAIEDREAQVQSMAKTQAEMINRIDAMSTEIIKLSTKFER